MDKDKNYFGIDVSKSTFDVYNLQKGHIQFENNTKGFKHFIKMLSSDSHLLWRQQEIIIIYCLITLSKLV